MGIGIHCVLQPAVPSADKYFTDGKNLAQAFMGATMGSFDFASMLDESAAEAKVDASAEEDAPTIFAAIEPFLDKEGGLFTGSFSQMHPPAAGLAGIEDTLRRLRSDEGVAAIPDADLRAGCVFDLETYAKMLREAEQHGAQFVLAFDV
jgi:hypothetical protein